jgi:hypothetical protein
MVSLEKVKLLESKVIRALDYIDQVTKENALLRENLEVYQKRIDGLEVVVQNFKEEQSQIEEGIVSALNRLSRFEADIEKSLALEKTQKDPVPQPEAKDTPELSEGKEDGDNAVRQDASYNGSLVIIERNSEDALVLEPETDDVPGDEETSDETLNPGELDIF